MQTDPVKANRKLLIGVLIVGAVLYFTGCFGVLLLLVVGGVLLILGKLPFKPADVLALLAPIVRAMGRSTLEPNAAPRNDRDRELKAWANARGYVFAPVRRTGMAGGTYLAEYFTRMDELLPLWRAYIASLPEAHRLKKNDMRVLTAAEAWGWRTFLDRYKGWRPGLLLACGEAAFWGANLNGAIDTIVYEDDAEWPVHAFDLAERREHSVRSHTVVALASPIELEPLFLRREAFSDKFAAKLGFNDIDFESIAFNETYFVKAADKKWAYDIVHQRMMEYLLEAPPYRVTMDLRHVFVHEDRAMPPEAIDDAVAFLRGFVAQIPEYVRNDRPSYPSAAARWEGVEGEPA